MNLNATKKVSAVIFSVDSYDRYQLDIMDSKELVKLATENFDATKADIIDLCEFQDMLNDERISIDSWWVYFVDND